MEKFNYGTFDPANNDVAYDSTKGYVEPSNETEVRKELSYPLKELKDFINDVLPQKEVGGSDKVVALKLTDDNLIQYSMDGETWLDTASGGHIIYDDDGNALPQKTRLMFKDTNVYNSGDFTVVQGLRGQQGVGVASVVQTTESHVSSGQNIWTLTLTNGNTYDFSVENGERGGQGEKGEQGNGLVIRGIYETLSDLQQAHPTGNVGDIYIVGTGAVNPAYVWDVDDQAWESIGTIRGEKGQKGDDGEAGAAGTGIQSVVETTVSPVSGGTNIWTVTLTNGTTNTFSVKNGEAGAAGEGMKTGGSAGQVLKKKTSVDYDTDWYDSHEIPSGGTSGQVLSKASATDYDTAWANAPQSIYWGDDASSLPSPINADTLQGYSVNTLMKAFFPVGSVIQNTTNTNPSTYITGTTWELKSSVALASEHVFGNGYSFGITDGTHIRSLRAQDSNRVGALNGAFGGSIGVAGYTNDLDTDKSTGVPTKSQLGSNPAYSGLIADTITIYTFERTA